jgi:hypothetical protein
MADKVLTVPFRAGGDALALVLNDHMTKEAVLEALVEERSSVPDQPTVLVWTVKGGSKSKMQAAPRAPTGLVGVVTLMRTNTNVFIGHAATFFWPTVRPNASPDRLMELVRQLVAQNASPDQCFVFGYRGKRLVLASCADLVLPEAKKKKSAKSAAKASAVP